MLRIAVRAMHVQACASMPPVAALERAPPTLGALEPRMGSTPLVDGGRGWVPCGLTPCSFSACYRSAGRVSADCNIASVMLVRCLLMIGQY